MTEPAAPHTHHGVTEAQVLDYLHKHPEFLRHNPDLLQHMAPPERELGDGVVDFQQFQVKNLQQNARSLQGKYESLVEFCRDNLSVQGQVHSAVLTLVQARTLEQLLAALTQDLLALFDLDVVRLIAESEIEELYNTYYSEDNYSGIVFVEPGVVQDVMGDKQVVLVSDASDKNIVGFERIFADCEGLILSCALMRLTMEQGPKHVALAFGVRYRDRFHPGQATDLLIFLATVVALQLDVYLLQDIGGDAPP